MDNVLATHTPTASARARAEAADIDLETLKQSDPEQYKMLNAVPVVTVAPALADMAVAVFLAAFPRYEVFKLEQEEVELLAFPPLTAAEQTKLDDALARLAAHPRYAAQHAYFRVVTDKRGEQRQFALATAPEAWSGQENVLVGPFARQVDAGAWAEGAVDGAVLLSDVIAQGDAWFVDVFSSS